MAKLISEIESKISIQYHGGAINWIDQKYGGAWSRAMDEFDAALSTHSPDLWRPAGQLYFERCSRWIDEYKQNHSIATTADDAMDLLNTEIKNSLQPK